MIKNKIPIRDEFEKLASISGSQLQQPCYGFLTYTMVILFVMIQNLNQLLFRVWNWMMKKKQLKRKRKKLIKKIRKRYMIKII